MSSMDVDNNPLVDLQKYLRQGLWHEFTETALATVPCLPVDYRVTIWKECVQPNMDKLNQISVAILAVHCLPDRKELGRELCSTVAAKIKKGSQQAYHILKAEESICLLAMGNQKEGEAVLDECEKFITSHESQDLELVTQATYYKSKATYLHHHKQYTEFYRTSLMYLQYAELDKLTLEEKKNIVKDIAISAIVGPNIYNFGELLLNPILNDLKNTEYEWLRDLIVIFNKGQLSKFEEFAQTSSSILGSVDEFVANSPFMLVKLRLMALLQHLFTMKDGTRILPFSVVKDVCKVEENDVERLLLKGFATGVIKGSIDQVNKSVIIKWVQSRVIDKDEIGELVHKIGEWHSRIQDELKVLQLEWHNLESEQ